MFGVTSVAAPTPHAARDAVAPSVHAIKLFEVVLILIDCDDFLFFPINDGPAKQVPATLQTCVLAL